MKVLVTAKRVVDYNVRVRVKADNTGVETANVKMSMNPFDEIGVEEAVRLREAGAVTEVVVASLGVAANQEVLRTALAMGADRAIHVECEQTLQPAAVSRCLAALVERENVDLAILGKQAIDDDCNQTAQMLAARLGWPQGTFACALSLTDDEVQVTREVDGGTRTVALTLPAVVSTDLRLNEPRYVKLPNIMKAKKKPLEKLAVSDLGVAIAPSVECEHVSEPPARAGGVRVADVAELVDKLRNEAQVI